MEPITQTPGYIATLLIYVESENILNNYGHVTQPLSDEQLSNKQRCRGCGLKPHQFKRLERRIKEDALKSARDGKTMAKARGEQEVLRNTLLCQFHPGTVVHKYWTCCSKHASAHPCSGAKMHKLNTQSLRELANLYQFHHTPQHVATSSSHIMRAAVALDCEMGTSDTGETELIRISMIDYFTGAVLVNSLVDPTVKMHTLNTKYSGVSWDDLRKARSDGNIIKGTTAARHAVWTHVGRETVVVGHSVNNDLRTMRWIHTRVVDSYIIAHTPVRKTIEEKKARDKAEKAEAKQKARTEQEMVEGIGMQSGTGGVGDAEP